LQLALDDELLEHEEWHEFNKSSSLSQFRKTEGIVRNARIGRVFFAPLLKNSRLLSNSSFELLSAIK
jgi:hypothetical protein